jgi:hypothetical protein
MVRPGPIGPGYGRYGVRAPGYRPYDRGYYGRGYPAYGYRGRYPYYGGAVAAGVIGGLAIGALSAPSYGYPYDYGSYAYPTYAYPTYGVTYGAPVAGANCWQGPPVCTAAGYLNMGYIRRLQGAPF